MSTAFTSYAIKRSQSEEFQANEWWERQLVAVTSRLNDGTFDHAIALSNQALDELLLQATSMVRLRAHAWSRKGNLTREMQDAMLIMEWAPHSALGYLLAGDIFISHGYQQQAIHFFKKGLLSVSPENDGYATLEERNAYAEAKQKKRIDIISQLPYDIFCKIGRYFGTDTLSECISVSHLWRNKFLECGAFWKDVNLAKRPMSFSFLPEVVDHIRNIRLDESTVQHVYDLMLANKFTNIRSVHLELPRVSPARFVELSKALEPNNPDYTNVFSRLLDILSSTAQLLTEIDINMENCITGPRLTRILTGCRNLTSIKYECPGFVFRGLSLPFATKLTKIHFVGVIRQVDLEGLLRCSPNIRYIRLEGCAYDAISVFNRVPLKLDYVSINCAEQFAYHPDEPNTPTMENYHCGLETLAVDGLTSPLTILSLLERNCNSLRTLYISCTTGRMQHRMGNLDTNWHEVEYFPIMTKLTTLHTVDMTLDLWKHIPNILRNCPSLRTFGIEGGRVFGGPDVDPVVNNIAKLITFPNLKLLNTDIRSESIQDLLDGLKDRSLEELMITDFQTNASSLIKAINIKSLKKLTVTCPQRIPLTTQEQYHFAHGVANLPNLKDLTLDGFYTFDDSAIGNLCNSKSLKSVQFYTVRGYTENGKNRLRDRIPPIQLTIYDRIWKSNCSMHSQI